MRQARETQANSYVCIFLFKYWRVTRSHTPSASICYMLKKHEHPDMTFYKHFTIANHLLVPVWRTRSPSAPDWAHCRSTSASPRTSLKQYNIFPSAVWLRDGEPLPQSRCCSWSAHSNNSQSLVVQQPQTNPLGGFFNKPYVSRTWADVNIPSWLMLCFKYL